MWLHYDLASSSHIENAVHLAIFHLLQSIYSALKEFSRRYSHICSALLETHRRNTDTIIFSKYGCRTFPRKIIYLQIIEVLCLLDEIDGFCLSIIQTNGKLKLTVFMTDVIISDLNHKKLLVSIKESFDLLSYELCRLRGIFRSFSASS